MGYITGNSKINLLGRYEISTDAGASIVYKDPFTISNSVGGITANIGTKIKLGFF